MSEQLKQQTLYDVAEANVKNLIWVDVYVSGTEGSAGVYATRRMTKAQLITFLNSNLSVAWSTISSKPTTVSGFGITDAVDTTGGTANYVAKFTDANTIEESLLRDNGSGITVGIPPTDDTYKLRIKSQSATGQVSIYGENWATTVGGESCGVAGSGYGSASLGNVGVAGYASLSTVKNVGGRFRAEDANPYALELQDNTEGVGKILKCMNINGGTNWTFMPAIIQLAVSDEITALTTGTGKITFRMPHAMTLTEVRASLTTAQTSGSILTIDVNEGGASVISTKVTIDNTEKTSKTAATPSVISDSSLADDAEITIDIDQVGDGTAKGLKITLIGTRSI